MSILFDPSEIKKSVESKIEYYNSYDKLNNYSPDNNAKNYSDMYMKEKYTYKFALQNDTTKEINYLFDINKKLCDDNLKIQATYYIFFKLLKIKNIDDEIKTRIDIINNIIKESFIFYYLNIYNIGILPTDYVELSKTNIAWYDIVLSILLNIFQENLFNKLNQILKIINSSGIIQHSLIDDLISYIDMINSNDTRKIIEFFYNILREKQIDISKSYNGSNGHYNLTVLVVNKFIKYINENEIKTNLVILKETLKHLKLIKQKPINLSLKMEETPSDFNSREPYKIFDMVSLRSIKDRYHYGIIFKESSSSSEKLKNLFNENLKLCNKILLLVSNLDFDTRLKQQLKLFVNTTESSDLDISFNKKDIFYDILLSIVLNYIQLNLLSIIDRSYTDLDFSDIRLDILKILKETDKTNLIEYIYRILSIYRLEILGFLDEYPKLDETNRQINSNYRFSIISELVSSKSEIIFNQFNKLKEFIKLGGKARKEIIKTKERIVVYYDDVKYKRNVLIKNNKHFVKINNKLISIL